jgi:hypothetical protein
MAKINPMIIKSYINKIEKIVVDECPICYLPKNLDTLPCGILPFRATQNMRRLYKMYS